MPRNKRWPYDSGLRVPLIVHIPEKFRGLRSPEYKAGGTTERLVSFVDLAPTVLQIAGVSKPVYHQGSGFLGRETARSYVFGFRGRMDERYDLVRSAFDGRYVYLRQYMPHKIYGQHIAYMFETPTTAVWKQLYDEGKLNTAQRKFWEAKPFEELYDTRGDRDEVNNLVEREPGVLKRLRAALDEWILSTGDRGFLPEAELHLAERPYDVRRVKTMADIAASGVGPDGPLLAGLQDGDSAVRYWAAMGYLIRKRSDGLAEVMRRDASPSVRAIAAEAVGRFGNEQEAREAAEVLAELGDMSQHGVHVAMLALNALEALGARADGVRSKLRSLPVRAPRMPGRTDGYVGNLKKKLVGS